MSGGVVSYETPLVVYLRQKVWKYRIFPLSLHKIKQKYRKVTAYDTRRKGQG